MGYTRKEIRDELNAIFEDPLDLMWTKDQKNVAINYGIDALWPELRAKKVVNDITLVSGTYIYESATATDLTEEGFAFCELEVTSGPYRRLNAIFQRPNPAKAGGWEIHVDEDIASGDAGKKLKLWYQARHPRLVSDTGKAEIGTSVPVVMYAAMTLCTMFLPRGGHTELGPFIKMIPQWVDLWKKSKQENAVEPLPRLIGVMK